MVKTVDTPSNWIARGSADNAVATATKTGEVGSSHVIHGFMASFSASVSAALLQIKVDGVVIDEVYIYDTGGQVYTPGYAATIDKTVSAELVASGTAGVIGKVSIIGTTIKHGPYFG